MNGWNYLLPAVFISRLQDKETEHTQRESKFEHRQSVRQTGMFVSCLILIEPMHLLRQVFESVSLPSVFASPEKVYHYTVLLYYRHLRCVKRV